MLSTIGGLLFKIVFMIMVGYVAKRRGIITDEIQKGMSTLLLKIVVLFTILMSSQNDFSMEAVEVLKATGIIAVVYYGAGIPLMVLLSRKLKLPPDRQKMFVLTTVFSNCVFMGYPIMLELYGGIGLLAAVMYSMCYNLVMYTWGFAYIRKDGKLSIKSLVTNPVAVLSVIALIIYFSGWRFPALLSETMSSISSMTVPLSMIITGCSLVDSSIMDIIKDRQVYAVTLMRMIVLPLAVWGISSAVGMQQDAVVYSTMLCAFPVASLTVIMGEDYGCAPDYAAKAIVQSLVVMCVTLPVFALLLGR